MCRVRPTALFSQGSQRVGLAEKVKTPVGIAWEREIRIRDS